MSPLLLAVIVQFIRGFAIAYGLTLLLLSRINIFPVAAYLTAFIISFISLCSTTSNDGLIFE